MLEPQKKLTFPLLCSFNVDNIFLFTLSVYLRESVYFFFFLWEEIKEVGILKAFEVFY